MNFFDKNHNTICLALVYMTSYYETSEKVTPDDRRNVEKLLETYTKTFTGANSDAKGKRKAKPTSEKSSSNAKGKRKAQPTSDGEAEESTAPPTAKKQKPERNTVESN